MGKSSIAFDISNGVSANDGVYMELCQATLLNDWLTDIQFDLTIIACAVCCLIGIWIYPLLRGLVLLRSGRGVLRIGLRLWLLIRILVILLLLVWVVILLLLIWIIILLLLLLVVWVLLLVRVVVLLLLLLLLVLVSAHHKNEQDQFAKIFDEM